MSAAPATLKLGAIAPEDAFAVFAARRLLRPSFRWQDVWQQEHARGFAVAGVLRADILTLFRDAVEEAVAKGQDPRDFAAALKRQLVAKGFWGDVEVTDPATGEVRTSRFNDRRLRLIFDVNMRQSHAAGRWARGMRSRKTHVLYRTMGDEHVRASHRPWDWICLPKDHPFWDTHTPPNGWGCRCYFMFVDEADIERLIKAGKKIKREAPVIDYVDFRNTATGEVQRVPRGIDPGFAYNPGRVHVQSGTALLTEALARLQRLRAPVDAARPAAAAEGHALVRAAVAASRRDPAFREFVTRPPLVRAGEPPVGMPVAAVPPLSGQPVVASVSAADLANDVALGAKGVLPTSFAGWATVQATIDAGNRLQLDAAGLLVLWWRRSGDRIDAVVMRRDALVWWVDSVQRLSVAAAVEQWPRLATVVQP